jgi:hypothetical protein
MGSQKNKRNYRNKGKGQRELDERDKLSSH